MEGLKEDLRRWATKHVDATHPIEKLAFPRPQIVQLLEEGEKMEEESVVLEHSILSKEESELLDEVCKLIFISVGLPEDGGTADWTMEQRKRVGSIGLALVGTALVS